MAEAPASPAPTPVAPKAVLAGPPPPPVVEGKRAKEADKVVVYTSPPKLVETGKTAGQAKAATGPVYTSPPKPVETGKTAGQVKAATGPVFTSPPKPVEVGKTAAQVRAEEKARAEADMRAYSLSGAVAVRRELWQPGGSARAQLARLVQALVDAGHERERIGTGQRAVGEGIMLEALAYASPMKASGGEPLPTPFVGRMPADVSPLLSEALAENSGTVLVEFALSIEDPLGGLMARLDLALGRTPKGSIPDEDKLRQAAWADLEREMSRLVADVVAKIARCGIRVEDWIPEPPTIYGAGTAAAVRAALMIPEVMAAALTDEVGTDDAWGGQIRVLTGLARRSIISNSGYPWIQEDVVAEVGMYESGLPMADHEMFREAVPSSASASAAKSRVLSTRNCGRFCTASEAAAHHATGVASILIGDLSRGQMPDFPTTAVGLLVPSAVPADEVGTYASGQTRDRLRAWSGRFARAVQNVLGKHPAVGVVNRSNSAGYRAGSPAAAASGRTAQDRAAKSLFDGGALLVKSAGNYNSDELLPTLDELIIEVSSRLLAKFAGDPEPPIVEVHTRVREWSAPSSRPTRVPEDYTAFRERYSEHPEVDDAIDSDEFSREWWAERRSWALHQTDGPVRRGEWRDRAVRSHDAIADVLKLIRVTRRIERPAGSGIIVDWRTRADDHLNNTAVDNVFSFGALGAVPICNETIPGHWCNRHTPGAEGAEIANVGGPSGPYVLVVGARSAPSSSYQDRFVNQSLGGRFVDARGVERRRTVISVCGVEPFAWAAKDQMGEFVPDFNATSCAAPTVAAVLAVLQRIYQVKLGLGMSAAFSSPGMLQALTLALGDGWSGVAPGAPAPVVGVSAVSGVGVLRTTSVRRLVSAASQGGYGAYADQRIAAPVWYTGSLLPGEQRVVFYQLPEVRWAGGTRYSIGLFMDDPEYLRSGLMARLTLRVRAVPRAGGPSIEALDDPGPNVWENRLRVLIVLPDTDVYDVVVTVTRIVGSHARPVRIYACRIADAIQ